MNNSILRVEHGASAEVIRVIQNMLKVGRLDYNIESESVCINEITGKRSYIKQQRVKTYDIHEAIDTLEEYIQDLSEVDRVTTRNVRKKAVVALELLQSIALSH